jgi:hypothetical protein
MSLPTYEPTIPNGRTLKVLGVHTILPADASANNIELRAFQEGGDQGFFNLPIRIGSRSIPRVTPIGGLLASIDTSGGG